MNAIERRESGASEVIGAVLLVSLVVIGGAVIAAFVFGQPTPKEVPHVEFGVSLNDSVDELTLHHTGGDTLLPGEYHILVDDVDKTGDTRGIDQPWNSDGDLVVTGVTQSPGTVVLTYLDKESGETVLRRVPFEDYSLRGVIWGYKYNVTGGQMVLWTPDDPTINIHVFQKHGQDFEEVAHSPVRVDTSGRYSITLPLDAWGTFWVEEDCPADYAPISPSSGRHPVDVTPSSPIRQWDFKNRLLPEPVVNPRISISKVTSDGTAAGTGDGLTYDQFTPIIWKYNVTNTGDVALNNIQVTDSDRAVTPVYQSGDTNGDGYLNLTETWIYTATGTAIEGSYTNIGTATGTPPKGGSVTASDSSSYTGLSVEIVPTTITGTKYRVDENGQVIAGEPNIVIRLELVEPLTLLPILEGEPYGFKNGVTTTTTGADGSYSFVVPDVEATYRLSEVIDPRDWWIQREADDGAGGKPDGIINGTAPGETGRNFYNYRVPGNGVVMYLDKAVEPGCTGGHVADGTTLEGEASKNDHISFMFGTEEQTYKFKGNEQFRLTIAGDQDVGEVLIKDFEMISLTFNVTFEVRPDRYSAWTNPVIDKGSNQFNPGNQIVTGVPTSVNISAINKNLLNENSTLEYHQPTCIASQTLLRLNGQVRISSPSDPSELRFTNLHEVHDNRYGEGLNTMWIYLRPGYDYLLAQGVCVLPGPVS